MKNGSLNVDGVRSLLKQRCDAAGAMKTWAVNNGLSTAYVCDVIQERRQPGEKILAALGLQKRVIYDRIKN